MEKLKVKNFGSIKEAEIDLTKYVVFIGDTSTVKSVLAKLISIFRDSFLLLSNNEFYFVELKGKDVNTAFDQIVSTITLFENGIIKIPQVKKICIYC